MTVIVIKNVTKKTGVQDSVFHATLTIKKRNPPRNPII